MKTIKISEDFFNRAKTLVKNWKKERGEELNFDEIFEEGLLSMENNVWN
ncbi:hypothetical protein LD119_00700 [Mesoplasma sp. JKS002660]|nr:hypothetical protein [Mesoplasma sp. JKS002660]MCL8213749.1 hypothetical protein [Mesoplasma sp. JKS002660]